MAGDLEPLEEAVLDKLLAGNLPVLAALRSQLVGAKVRSRELTGVGFFTEFVLVPDAVPAPVSTLRFGDVQATVSGLKRGAGFVIFVDHGLLTMLEGYSYDEPWPETIDEFALSYIEPGRPNLANELCDAAVKLRRHRRGSDLDDDLGRSAGATAHDHGAERQHDDLHL